MAKTGKTAFMAFDLTQRDAQIRSFLTRSGWDEAMRLPLEQDASTRRYERIRRPDGATAMLMDAPAIEDAPCPPDADGETRRALGWNALTRLAASRVEAFVALAGELRARGLRAPYILAHDREAGLALIEDFGEAREFARLIETGAASETHLYTEAARTLAHLHAHPAPDIAKGHGERWPILDFDALALATNADVFVEWYPRYASGPVLTDAQLARWEGARDRLIEQAMTFPRAFTLRDFHAENLLWLEQQGAGEVGLLDFQDAVRGWEAWDLAMLTQDARRPVSDDAREAALNAYADLSGTARSDLDQRLAVIGTLNALRIAGLFARLIHRDHKPRYQSFMPRQQAHLAANLVHPALTEMAALTDEIAPDIRSARP